MSQSSFLPRLCAAALVLSTSSAAAAAPVEDTLNDIKAQIDALKQQGKYTVNPGSLAIESWLLTSTAIDSTAGKIGTSVAEAIKGDGPRAAAAHLEHRAAHRTNADDDDDSGATEPTKRKILVLTAADPLDFSQVAMLSAEMQALTDRLATVCGCMPESEPLVASAAPAIIGAVAGLLKSDTELTAIDQTVDAKLLASAVAGQLDNAILPSAAIAATGGGLIDMFNELVDTADAAQSEYDRLAVKQNQSDLDKAKVAKLKRLLDRYDSFYARATTANANGVVPLAYAARLEQLMEDDPYVLRVNTEKAGGTLVKRTNVLTALGASSAFITGGLVSSFQLTDPVSGQLIKAGVITCRTTLASLKRVQDASWRAVDASGRRTEAKAICSP